MYDFYYNQMMTQYGERCQLLFTDTDSLLLEIQTDDVYQDMTKHPDLYDTPNYQKDHPLYSAGNEEVLGKMKDECAGRPIAEYVGLRTKMYSILEASGKSFKKAKGVKKNTVKKHVHNEQYKEALFKKQNFLHGMDGLRSERYRIYGQRLKTVLLSPFDSKGWIAENEVDTLATKMQSLQVELFNTLGKTPSGGSCVSGGTTSCSSRANPRGGLSSR